MAVNIVSYDGSSELAEFSEEQKRNLAYDVLEYMAANTSCAGTLTIDSSNPIGTFTDSVRQGAVGSQELTILYNTYTLSQTNTATFSSLDDPPLYVGVNVSGNTISIQENLTTKEDLVNYIIQTAISSELFCYRLGVTPPSDGGVWTNIGNILDTLENFTITNNSYGLWRKISSGAINSYNYPLKIQSNTLTEFSQEEIYNFSKLVENKIISTGVLNYKLQNAVPTTGIWEDVGTIIDLRRTISPTAYVGEVAFSSAEIPYLGPGEQTYYGTVYSNFYGVTEQAFLGTTPTTSYGVTPTTSYGATPGAFTGTLEQGFTGSQAVQFYGTTPTTSYGTYGVVYYYGPTPASFAGTTPQTFYGTTPQVFYGTTPQAFYGITPATYYATTVSYGEIFEGFYPKAFYAPIYSPLWPSTSYGYVYLAFEGEFFGFVGFDGTTPTTSYGSTPTTSYGVTPTTSYGFTPTTSYGTAETAFGGVAPAVFYGTTPAAFTGYIPATYVGTTYNTYYGVVSQTFYGSTPASFAGVTPANYVGFTPATYNSSSEQPYIGTNPDMVSFYSATAYVADLSFYGIAVSSSLQSVASVTLWKRIG